MVIAIQDLDLRKYPIKLFSLLLKAFKSASLETIIEKDYMMIVMCSINHTTQKCCFVNVIPLCVVCEHIVFYDERKHVA